MEKKYINKRNIINRFHYLFILVFSSLVSWNCQEAVPKINAPLFEPIAANHSKVIFQNRLRESPSQNVLTYEYFYNGAGLAVADFNNDQKPDLYFVSNLETNHLYLNRGNFKFEETTLISKVGGSRGFDMGVTVVDINQDGLLDLYLCKSGRFEQADFRRNQLFINQGNNEDGIPIFIEQAKKYGIDIATYSTQAAFFDYDKDGDLDMFLINHGIDTYPTAEIPNLSVEKDPLIGEMLFQNENDFFTEVTDRTGIVNNKLGFGLGVAIGDLNNDAFPDVYVSNDYSGKDHLYINQKNGTFKEFIQELTSQISFYAMGNDIGDINNDGWQDIVNLDMVAADNYGIKTSMSAMNPKQFQELVDWGEHYQYMYNSLLLNNGVLSTDAPQFSNIAQLAGISNTDWSWAPLLFDMDNDGWQDLYVTNGIKRNIRNNDAMKKVKELNAQMLVSNQPNAKARFFKQMLDQFPYHRKANFFFLNQGALQFDNITKDIGLDSMLTASNGAVYADLDADGDLDLIVNNVDQPALLLKNNRDTYHGSNFLKIKCLGTKKNLFGIGTKVTVFHRGQQQTKEVYTSRGYLSSIAPNLHFGLGKNEQIDSLHILWPDGKWQKKASIKGGQTIVLKHQEAFSQVPKSNDNTPLFSPSKNTPITYEHQENLFDDFQRESLLPHKMSNLGPASAIGDVNGDGRDDLYIGGAKHNNAQLFLQQTNGQFKPSMQPIWQAESWYEDVSAIFLDADNDNDLDLIVGSGGNEWEAGHKAYQLRLYENDGSGNFSRNEQALPSINVSVGVLTAGDWNNDGRLDLFVGGRQVPGQYPKSANSYLLQNESQGDQLKFEDITVEKASFLADFGRVTAAKWVDLDQDQQLDLVAVGEWMSPKILMNKGDHFSEESENANLAGQVGWWYSLASADFDQDGDMDLVVGNLGLNYKYKASQEAPFQVFYQDFDQNGSGDIVLGYHSQGDLYPLRGRECSSGQMPFIKSNFTTYEAFGKATLTEVYPKEQLNSSIQYKATTFAHTYFENQGDGTFVAHVLPIESQVSSINAFLIDDFNQDTHLDILVAGNLLEAEIETPRNDASIGLLLTGDGTGKFLPIPAEKSGWQVGGEIRKIHSLMIPSQASKAILAVKNKGAFQTFRWENVNSLEERGDN